MQASLAGSFRRLLRQPLRSVLTLLQVAIGVLAVTVALHAVQARTRSVLAPDVFYVFAGEPFTATSGYGYDLFRAEDLPKLRALAGEVQALELHADGGRFVTLQVGDARFEVGGVADVGGDYARLAGLTWQQGGSFTSTDRDVIAVSQEVATFMFPNGNAVGQTVRFGSSRFPGVAPALEPRRIVGVYIPRAGQWISPILAPLTSYGASSGSAGRLIVRAQPGALTTARASLLAAIRKLYSGDEARGSGAFKNFKGAVYATTQPDASLGATDRPDPQSLTFTAFAVIILLTSVIGVFSTRLIDVIERTRELAMRRAMGAGRREIVAELMFDGLFSSSLGAGIGIALAYLAFPSLQTAAGPFLFIQGLAFDPLLACLVFVTTVALITVLGSYPALNAVRPNPAETLRNAFTRSRATCGAALARRRSPARRTA